MNGAMQRVDGGTAVFDAQTAEQWELVQRQAKALAQSSLVPKEYQGNIANVVVAMDVASRIGAAPLQVMQNLDIIHGRPSFRAKFLIATVNASKAWTPIRYETSGDDASHKGYKCRAYAKCRETDETCHGPWITWTMVDAEGWSKKSGTKWKTMPELMFCYRAAAFWTRLYAPELSLGIQTTEEVMDVHGYEQRTPVAGRLAAESAVHPLAAAMADPVPDAEVVDETTGEVIGGDDASGSGDLTPEEKAEIERLEREEMGE